MIVTQTRHHPRDNRLGCVIVTYNRADRLRTCLTRTLAQDVDLLVVIDNASSDSTPELLAEFQARHHRLIVDRQRKNRGGAWGFARGMRVANRLLGGSGWLLLFDDDSWPAPECIARFHDRVSRYRSQGVAAVGAAVFAMDGRVVEANRPVLNLFRRPVKTLLLTATCSSSLRDLYHVPRSLIDRAGQWLEVDSISFVGMFLDLEALPLGRARYPRGALFIYSDDTTYTLQLGRIGCRMFLDTDLVFCHDTNAGGAGTSWLIPSWKNYYIVRNSFLMNRSLSHFWYIPLCLATVLIHAFRGLYLYCFSRDSNVLDMVLLGVRDGLINCYSRSHADLERRCASSSRRRRTVSV